METVGYKLKVTYLTPILGSQPTRDIATRFIAQRAGYDLPEDEEPTLPEALERGTTAFHKLDDEKPILWNYHVKGFLKYAGHVLNAKDGMPRNLKAKVEQTVFVSPRTISLRLPVGMNGASWEDVIDYYERPIRIDQGYMQRVALARSEMLPEGVWFTCNIETLPGEISETVLRNLLDYGYYSGISQFRNGGFGQFTYELTRED